MYGEGQVREIERPSLARRISTFPLTRLIIGGALVAAAAFGADILARTVRDLFDADSRLLRSLIRFAITVPAVVAVYCGYVKLVERRPVKELSLRRFLPELGLGAALGALIFAAVIGTIWVLGAYTVEGVSDWTPLLAGLAGALSTGFFEEILFRGILFRIVEEALGTWLSIVVSALFFGLIHMVNPNSHLLAGLCIALEAGVLLAAAYVLTRRLWLAIGLHAAWNYVQGSIFGANVSGTNSSGFLQGKLEGSDLITGGDFGPEASVPAVVLGCVAAAILVALSIKRRNMVKPFWMR